MARDAPIASHTAGKNAAMLHGFKPFAPQALRLLLLCLLATVAAADAARAADAPPKKLKVFILAGQSNMEGHGGITTFDYVGKDPLTAPLLAEMRNADGTPRVCDKVWISYLTGPYDGSANGEGLGKLTAGFGYRGDNPAQISGKIGPEFTFGIFMEKAVEEPILIIKTAWGGRSLNTEFRPPSAGPYVLPKEIQEAWDKHPQGGHGIPKAEDRKKWWDAKHAASGAFYRMMIEHVKKVLADPKRVCPEYDEQAGYELAGFVWLQGFNDLVDGQTYPKGDEPGGYDEYSRLLAHFIRDVRKDLSAPKLPFAIGVLGVDGEKHASFRKAMAAPAEIPEFKGNVVAVDTARFWDHAIAAAQPRKAEYDTIVGTAHLLNADGTLDADWKWDDFWKPVGKPLPEERTWRFVSLDATEKKDKLETYDGRRFRDITLPAGMENWFAPDFDDSQWTAGKAPIGKGVWKHSGITLNTFPSAWGDGEFLLMRTTFDIEDLDCESYRIAVLARQGFRVYVNGQELHTYIWWQDNPVYRSIVLEKDQVTKVLKKGKNVLAVYANDQYDEKSPEHYAAIDLRVEGITKADRQALDLALEEVLSPKEREVLEGQSDGGYHYWGSAKFFAQLGKAFADALVPLQQGCDTDDLIYRLRPDPTRERFFGVIGVTGLETRIYPGVVLKVEGMVPGSPAAGKFAKGEILTGINGTALEGRNPFVVMGTALTQAEATDGRMVFDVTSADGKTRRQETVAIPVLGAYSATWPLECAKSKRIIEQAAEFYADPKKFNEGGIPGALACLFLLSTGDDHYLPRVKAYFDAFPKDVRAIGDHTWDNGYNGIACGEYYLRTGDTSVLPILQHYCDDAKARQKFGCGWTHWGLGISPGYVAGGLMNPAGAQVLTTLLLGKECGVNVDEETLLGALRFFYRFAGRGTVPYGDHRGEGGLGSNGKDGMVAAAMQIATGARGDVSCYEQARRCLAMSMIDSYPQLVQGHADEGRGDGLWRGISTAALMQEKPALYRESMDRLTWWHDLSREPGGSIGIATLIWEEGKVGSSGPGMGLSYTAPLKTLRITGAPRSKHSHDYTLPENPWGTAADRAFLSIEHNPKYFDSRPEEPTHVPFNALGNGYEAAKNLERLPRETLLKNVYHRNYLIRAQAAKGLRAVGGFDDLEKLLRDPDPRVRRAALDGLIDYNYWFAIGRSPIPTDKLSPAMLESITAMLSDPDESWWVVDGALMALKFAPAADIQARLPLIMPWTKHADWWLRESAFMALSGLEKDDSLYLDILPTLLTMATGEYHTQPRWKMTNHLEGVLNKKKPASPAGKLIMAGLEKSIAASEIKSGERASEGAYNVFQTVMTCLQSDPGNAVAFARVAAERIGDFSTDDLVDLLAAPQARPERLAMQGLFTSLEKLPPDRRAELTDILFTAYRPECLARMQAGERDHQPLLTTAIELTKLKNPAAGWKPLGAPPPAERVWRFTSFDPLTEKDRLHPREMRRFRDVELPAGLAGWQKPGYDDSNWQQGPAPIGIGICEQGGVSFANRSAWGKGEFIVMRTTFEVKSLDCDAYRLSILARQGFRVFLNGHEISDYGWWMHTPCYRPVSLGADAVRHLKTGTNVLAAYGNVEYDEKTQEPRGQMDLLIEGLKMADLTEPAK